MFGLHYYIARPYWGTAWRGCPYGKAWPIPNSTWTAWLVLHEGLNQSLSFLFAVASLVLRQTNYECVPFYSTVVGDLSALVEIKEPHHSSWCFVTQVSIAEFQVEAFIRARAIMIFKIANRCRPSAWSKTPVSQFFWNTSAARFAHRSLSSYFRRPRRERQTHPHRRQSRRPHLVRQMVGHRGRDQWRPVPHNERERHYGGAGRGRGQEEGRLIALAKFSS